MKEQFDKKLVEKIKASFQNHEEPYDPQEWEKLSHAYFRPVKKKKFVFWPFLASGIAATLLLLLVFWPIGDDLQKNVQTITDSISIPSKQFERIELPRDKAEEQLALKEAPQQAPMAAIPPEDATDTARAGSEDNMSARGLGTGINPIPIPSLPERDKGMQNSAKLKQGIKQHTGDEKFGDLITAQAEESDNAQRYINQWKAEGQPSASEADSPAKEKNNNVRLGVMVGPQTSSNPVAGMSLGAGVMSEFSFSSRFKLDIGVTYARHSLVPNNGHSLPQNEMFSSLSARTGFIGSNAELNFTGLDIPINLKYKVMDNEQSGLFLITGLSSMVYLNQQTTETMAVHSYFTANTNGTLDFQQSVQEFTHEAGPVGNADSFDLGRMLNLSIGYEYSLKNGTYLSIEPYYKLPLGDMTFANQQFSIGGLNLRMNFRIGK